MIIFNGKGASFGKALGSLFFYKRNNFDIPKTRVNDINSEIKSFEDACDTAVKQLEILCSDAEKKAGKEEAFLFETHLMIIHDPDFFDEVETLIRKEKLNAAAAVYSIGKKLSETFSESDNDYMKARAVDFQDISLRVISVLTNSEYSSITLNTPVILVADDLTPSETISLDKSKILGLVTYEGTVNSHTAILSRTLGIPSVIGMGEKISSKFFGSEAFIDGEKGCVITDLSDNEKLMFLDELKAEDKKKNMLSSLKGRESCTADGRKIKIMCNIGSPKEARLVQENDGEGIGLFRSEFLFLNKDNPPSEQQQFEDYKLVVQMMKEKLTIIRTIDIGADKQAECFKLKKEPNPALGLRAIRICLEEPEIFRTQLRAIYRASVFGKTAIMFPMIASLWELKEAKKICRQVREELKTENMKFDEDVKIGIMIETPAAVMIANSLAKEADFFSVGTNDLTQYTLAIDRQSKTLDRFYDPYHPAVMKMLEMTVQAAHKNNISVGICGETASDLNLTESFVNMGIDELSVSPCAVLPLREKIRKIHSGSVQK